MCVVYFPLFLFCIFSFTQSLFWKGCSLHSGPAALLSCLARRSTFPSCSWTASSSDQALTTPSSVRLSQHSKTPYLPPSLLFSLPFSFFFPSLFPLSHLLYFRLSWLPSLLLS